MRTLLFIGVLAAIVGGIVWSHNLADTYGYASPSVSASSGPDEFDACVMAEKLIKQQLKAPATADFPSCRDADITQNGSDSFTISSHVDSENGFGANVRTYYTAHVSMDDDGTWHLESFQTQP